MWIVLGILAVIAFFAIAASQEDANKVEQTKFAFEETKKHLDKRVAAHADYLRRTSGNPDVRTMSDRELHDSIERAMEEYHKRNSSAKWPLYIGLAIGGLALLAIANGQDLEEPAFVAPVAIGVFIWRWQVEKIKRDFTAAGWDIDRLKIE